MAVPDPKTKPIKRACVRPPLAAPNFPKKESGALVPNDLTVIKRGMAADNRENTEQKHKLIRQRSLKDLFKVYLENGEFPGWDIGDGFQVEVNRDELGEEEPQKQTLCYKQKIQKLTLYQRAAQRATSATQLELGYDEPPPGRKDEIAEFRRKK